MSTQKRVFLTDGEIDALREHSGKTVEELIALSLIRIHDGEAISFISRDPDVCVSRPTIDKYEKRLIEALNPDFLSDETQRLGIDLNDICKKISKAGYELGSINAPDNSTQWLNQVLKVPNLYDQYVNKNKGLPLPEDLKCLVDQTRETRSKEFKHLSSYDAFNIKRLNRKVLNHWHKLPPEDWLSKVFKNKPLGKPPTIDDEAKSWVRQIWDRSLWDESILNGANRSYRKIAIYVNDHCEDEGHDCLKGVSYKTIGQITKEYRTGRL